MRCSEFELYTAQYLENELPPASPAAAHLKSCPQCAAHVADLEQIINAAATLPVLEPPERVWSSLRVRLEQEGMFRRRPGLLERLGFGTVPAQPGTVLATAAICALAAALLFLPQQPERGSAAAGRGARPTWSFPGIQQELASAEAEQDGNFNLRDPEVVASYRQNLALVDNLIGVCQKSVNDNPDDEMARDYLLTAYQQKADLLSALSERDALGD
ncbi:MAG TPA: hypothetical protein VL099_08490 [Candidatus Binatia bacterium]|nr:hypothetical protein [Candidatus Binatia bacterium]